MIFITLILLAILAGAIFLVVRPGFADEPGIRIGVRIGAGVVATLMVLFLAMGSIKSVGATEVGVPITLGQPGAALGPGPHLTLPWTSVETLDVKTQNIIMDNDGEVKTITVDRVQTPIDVVVYFHVDPDHAPTLLLTVGEDYVDKIIKPLARSVVYDKGSLYSAENIQNERNAYEDSVEEALRPALAARGIILEKVEIKKIQLPDSILNNAQAKINAEEARKRAVIDAETKVIEAKAQAQSNEIIANSTKQASSQQVCEILLVQAMAQGKITGPLYVNPCTGATSGVLVTKSAG